MAGGDTGAVSAAGGGTGVRIFNCMRAAVDTHTNRDPYSNPDIYSHAHTSSNPSAYSDSNPYTVGVTYILTSSNSHAVSSAIYIRSILEPTMDWSR